ncbi:transcriptional regulator BetI [Lacimicrobium alkaliphilum]|uniref:HTH-type transcriptional regulator BetI n=1 Tax=Lacimicrobium alkaliphilum TaxID=1526571 RepID=A0ABQ1R856_9ALTE|nr:transcriptional regulator BetI [Lacimicrobium alkaliphilum]GGD59104.1 HTH-type transcriptional regulator BetI [Lacimicrobium alkaliphilum]
MPKLGMEEIRRQQLINATLESVSRYGLHNTTINTISGIAGLSSGIISHYFGGKQALLEATVRYLLEKLKTDLLEQMGTDESAERRLMRIVDANFTNLQRSDRAGRTWLAFWAQSMHSPALMRLQRVNAARLEANLRYSFRTLIRQEQVRTAAAMTAAMIDGFWLRCTLDAHKKLDFEEASRHCKSFIQQLLEQHSL